MLLAFPLYWPSLFCTFSGNSSNRDCYNKTVSFTSCQVSDTNPIAAPSAACPDAHTKTGKSPRRRQTLMPHETLDLFVGRERERERTRKKPQKLLGYNHLTLHGQSLYIHQIQNSRTGRNDVTITLSFSEKVSSCMTFRKHWRLHRDGYGRLFKFHSHNCSGDGSVM